MPDSNGRQPFRARCAVPTETGGTQSHEFRARVHADTSGGYFYCIRCLYTVMLHRADAYHAHVRDMVVI